jgi:hypothetical protein
VRELIEGKEARETEEKEVLEGEKPVPKEEIGGLWVLSFLHLGKKLKRENSLIKQRWRNL